ncbi:MAG: hypothetical protein ACUVQ1_05325 [Candidatus Kapaibacteriales bacterium]
MKFYNLIFGLLFFLSGFSLAQDNSKPLELPNFIIEGKEQIDIQIASKQFPLYQTFMSSSFIDTLNYLEKPRSYVIFPYSIPDKIIQKNYPNGYLGLNFGSFITLGVNVGYRTTYKDYVVFGLGDFETSHGHIDNAGYFKYLLSVQSDYVAPEKFFVFSGSKTTTNFNITGQNYALYSIDTAPRRNSFDLNFSIQSIGEFEGNSFELGAKTYLFNQSGVGAINENSLSGYLQFQFPFYELRPLTNFTVNIRNSKKQTANYYDFWILIPTVISDFSVKPIVGLQIGQTTYSNSRLGFHLELPVVKTINKDLVVNGKIFTRINENSFASLAMKNPYLSDSVELDYSKSTGISLGINYYPKVDLFLSSEVTFLYASRDVCFDVSSSGLFNVRYLTTSSFKFSSEGRYELTRFGIFSTSVVIEVSTINSNKRKVPNRPIFKFGTKYSKEILNNLNFGLKFERFGERFADVDNKLKLYGYNNLGISINYLLGKFFVFDFELENLLNSSIYYWYNYKERGFSFSLKLKYKF